MAEKEQGFRKMLEKSIVENIRIEHPVVLKGQYETAYSLLKDALDTGITPCLVGPPGVGKSLLARKVAEDTARSFHEVFFDENVTPSRLIGSFDPALVVRSGRNISSFEPGPLIRAMVEGGLFVAHELNRATEFCQNSLIAPLEERHYHLFPLGMVKAQGGDASVIEDTAKVPPASFIATVDSPSDGWVAGLDAMEVGGVAVLLGAGRMRKEDPVDPSSGILLRKKTGDRVLRGETLATIFANQGGRIEEARRRLLTAYRFKETTVPSPPVIDCLVDENGERPS